MARFVILLEFILSTPAEVMFNKTDEAEFWIWSRSAVWLARPLTIRPMLVVAEGLRVGVCERTLLPSPVEVVTPVPPLATARVPDSEIAPEVADEGNKPVEPPEKVVTPVVEVR